MVFGVVEGIAYHNFAYWFRQLRSGERDYAIGVTMVELTSPWSQAFLPETMWSIITANDLIISVADSEATISVQGSLSLEKLARIVESVAGEDRHVSA